MPTYLTNSELDRFSGCPVECKFVKERVEHLADFFNVVNNLTTDEVFWFRGHEKTEWNLVPSALRYDELEQRDRALRALGEFRRIAELKIVRPPDLSEQLKWVQLAQHYGLPTRLLDWTESATIGLYFACLDPNADGILFVMNPAGLNALGPARSRRVLTMYEDADLVNEYLRLSGQSQGGRGRPALAINPVWNSERLVLQRGAFTLHGTRFALDTEQAPSLVAIPILKEAKSTLRRQLSRIGVDRLTIFPELEHTCAFLKDRIEGNGR